MNVKRLRKQQELQSVLKMQKSETFTKGEDSDTDDSPTHPRKKLSPKAIRRLKTIKANQRFREIQTVARDNTLVKCLEIKRDLINSPNYTSKNEGIGGNDFLSGATLLYGISEGATGTIQDFDKILEALKNDTFLSRDFNLEQELRAYKLDKDGLPKYKGGGKGNVKPEDVAKAAKKFKFNAKLIQGGKMFGGAANLTGLALTAIESWDDGEISTLEAMDILMGIMAFVPGYGWVISGTWSVVRITVPEKVEYSIKMDNGIRRHGEW